ncbi:MAG: hypothetical protein AAGL10_05115 [Pseudomonadota bacterium]
MTKRILGALTASIAIILAIAGCKPPPGDAGMSREAPEDEPVFASTPLPSPDTQDAIWASSSESEDRVVYGVPYNPALMTLECVGTSGDPLVEITRMAPADEGAQALLALVGNGAIGRIEVDASEVGSRIVWRGTVSPAHRDMEPLKGPRNVTATIPGAGMVELNPSTVPAAFLDACEKGTAFVAIGEDNPAEPEINADAEEETLSAS